MPTWNGPMNHFMMILPCGSAHRSVNSAPHAIYDTALVAAWAVEPVLKHTISRPDACSWVQQLYPVAAPCIVAALPAWVNGSGTTTLAVEEPAENGASTVPAASWSVMILVSMSIASYHHIPMTTISMLVTCGSEAPTRLVTSTPNASSSHVTSSTADASPAAPRMGTWYVFGVVNRKQPL